MSNTTLIPSAAAVRLTTNAAPMLLPGGLAFSGSVPTFGILLTVPILGNDVVPALQLLSLGPTLQLRQQASVGSVAFSGIAPVVNAAEVSLTPGVGATALTGVGPGLGAGLNEPSSSVLTLAGAAPTIGIPNIGIAVPAGAATFSGVAPVLPGKLLLTAGNVTLSGVAGTLTFRVVFGAAQSGSLGLNGVGATLGLAIVTGSGVLQVTTIRFSPNIALSSGAVSYSGSIPVLNGAQVIALASGGLSLNGLIGSQTLTVPAPPSANLVLGGYYPSLFNTYNLIPATGTASFVGATPATVQHSVVLTPQSGVVQLGVSSPPSIAFLGFNLFVPSISLLSTGLVSAISQGRVLTPSPSNLIAVGVASSLIPGSSSAPLPGALSLVGAAPGLISGTLAGPAGSALSLNSVAVTLNYSISPPAGSLGIVATPATVNGRTQIVIPSGVVATLGNSPVQALNAFIPTGSASLQGLNSPFSLTIAPSAVTVKIAGVAGGVNQQGLPFLSAGALSLAGVQPIVTMGAFVPTGAISLKGSAPSANSLTTLTPTSGAAAIAGAAPSITQLGVSAPLSGSLVFASDAAQLGRSGYAAPDTASMEFSGGVPGIRVTLAGICQPGAAAVLLGGQPAVTPAYLADPYYRVTLPAALFVVELPPGGEG